MGTPSLTLAAVVVVGVVALAGCGATTAPSPTGAPTSSLVPPLTGQTDTAWGRIWDSLPADFPVYAGAIPSEEATTGPYSANFVVNGSEAKAVTAWTAARLTQAGYAMDGGTTALEDGSYAIDGVRDIGCQVHIEVAPLGTLTSITILYGASCPND